MIINDQVCAGFPNPADDYVQTGIDLNELLVKHPASTFFIRVKGESMIGAEIHDGDVIMVDRSLKSYDGAIILALLNGEFTVKRYKKTGDYIELLPENKRFRAIRVSPDDDFEVWGVVSYIIHKSK
jgi:DNA polymerase V